MHMYPSEFGLMQRWPRMLLQMVNEDSLYADYHRIGSLIGWLNSADFQQGISWLSFRAFHTNISSTPER